MSGALLVPVNCGNKEKSAFTSEFPGEKNVTLLVIFEYFPFPRQLNSQFPELLLT